MKLTQSTLRKIIREELEEAYKSGAQRDKEMNAEIRMIKKDPEFRALVALEKAYHGRNRSIDDETPTVRYILLRRSDRKAMDPAAAMNNVIQDMSPGLRELAIKFEAMQPYFGAVNEAVRGKQRAHLEREAERAVAKELALADAAEIEEALGSRFRVTVRELEGRYQITVAKTADARDREEKTQRMIDGYLNRYPDSRPKNFGVRAGKNLFERPDEK